MRRLAYYTPQFPYPQGRSAGPFAMFLQPPNASLMRVRVACVAVGQQIGQPVKPNLKMQRNTCQCHQRRRPRGFRLGDDSTLFNPAVQDIADANTPIGYDSVTGQPIYASGGSYPTIDTSPPVGATTDPAVAAAVASSSAAGAPAGSSYTYTAIFDSWVGVHMPGTNAGGSNLSTALASVGIVVDSESDQGYLSSRQNGITLQVHTATDYGSAADVKSQIDHFVYQIVGRGNPARGPNDTGMPQSAMYQTGGGAGAGGGGGLPMGAPTWWSQNWQWVAIGGGAFLLVLLLRR